MTNLSQNDSQAEAPENAAPAAGPEAVAENPTAPADPTPTISTAPETGTADAAAGLSSAEPPPIKTHLRDIMVEVLTEIGKIEHFSEEELERFWKLISAKL